MNRFLHRRLNVVTISALFVQLACAHLVATARGQDFRHEKVPEDTCILELNLPNGATVSVDGRDYGTKRRLTYRSLQPGKTYTSLIHVTLPEGKEEQHKVLLEGGRRVALASSGRSAIRPELVLQAGHTREARCIALSPDGRRLLTGGHSDCKAILWDVSTGRQLRTLEGHAEDILSAAFSPSGRQAVTGSDDNTAILWDVVSGRTLRVLRGHKAEVQAAVFSPSGRQMLTGSGDHTAVVWDTATGRRLRSFRATGEVECAAFSPNSQLVVVGCDDGKTSLFNVGGGQSIRTFGRLPSKIGSVTFGPKAKRLLVGHNDGAVLFDASTGRQLQSYEEHAWIHSVALSRDGQHVLTGAAGSSKLILWDAASGEKLQVFQDFGSGDYVRWASFGQDGRPLAVYTKGPKHRKMVLIDATSKTPMQSFTMRVSAVNCVSFTPDGKHLVTGLYSSAVLWDLAGGTTSRAFHISDGPGGLRSLAFTPDGTKLLAGSEIDRPVLVEVATGQALRTFKRSDTCLKPVVLSQDGRHVLAATYGMEADAKAVLWDAATGHELLSVEPKIGTLVAVAFCAQGRQMVTASRDAIILWDTSTGEKLRVFRRRLEPDITCAVMCPDGQRLLAGLEGGAAILLDMTTGTKSITLRGHNDSVTSVAFGQESREVLTGSGDGRAILWDAVSGKALHVLQASSAGVNSVAFSPDGRQLAIGLNDGTARLFDSGSGRQLLQLVHLDAATNSRDPELTGQDWLVTTPEGFFDGSVGGREKLMFRVGGELNVVPVDRFFQDFYYPGLLAAIWRGERPLPKVEMGQSLPPNVKIVSPEKGGVVEADRVTLEVEVSDEGGGVRGPWLVQNEARVLAPERTQRQGKKIMRTFEIALVEGDNQLEFHAASADGSWESEPALMTLRYEQPLPKPELYLISVGINRYAEQPMNLGFTAGDAKTMAGLFRQRGPVLYGSVHATTLLDEEATSSAILQSLRDLAAKARPQDTVAVFLAGHGTVVGRQYYFLPHEFHREGDSLEKDVLAQGLSAARIQEALVLIPALKRIVVFDTGQSGGKVGLARTARDPFAFRGAIERLSRSSGAFMIAAAAVSDKAQEVPDLGHGVLTYTLLAGLQAAGGGPLEDQWIEPTGKDRVANVLDWFGFASSHVPRLTRQYFGRQQEVQHSSLGTSFPVLPVPASGKPVRIAATADSVPAVRPRPTSVTHGSGQAKLHVVAVGINQYREEAMNLKFARADAKAMAELFGERGKRQYREVSTAEVLDGQATKQGILDSLEKVAGQAQPEDTLVVFLSGHGRMVGQRYYLIPHDFHRQEDSVEEDIRRQGVPADVLADVVSKVPARKRILIFDTCASGGALKISRQGEGPFGFRGAIEKLGQRQGVFTIAASAAGQEAQEIEQLGHGVLTFALLAGLRAVPPGGPLEGLAVGPSGPEGTVDVLDWFSFASGHVPRLTKRYLGQMQDVQTAGQGTSFSVLPATE